MCDEGGLEDIVDLPKIIPRDIIGQLLDHLYRERSIKKYSEWNKKIILRDIAIVETLFQRDSAFRNCGICKINMLI